MENSENTSMTMQQNARIFCPKCFCTLQEFLETGFLGCENCYRVFKEQIDEYIKDCQPANIHTGKMYLKNGEHYAK